MSYNEFAQKYDTCISWLEYHQLCTAIPKCWIDVVNCNSFTLTKFNRIQNCNKIANQVYSSMIQNDTLLDKRRQRWERKLKTNIERKAYIKNFKNIYSQTIATKFRDFQYRLLVCALPMNRILYLWKIIDSQQCTFCGNEIEDEIHLFIECHETVKIWSMLQQYIENNDKGNIMAETKWDPARIIFSLIHDNPSNVVNFLCTITKQFIYRSRCIKAKMMPDLLLQDIENIYKLEENIAIRKNKWNRHVCK